MPNEKKVFEYIDAEGNYIPISDYKLSDNFYLHEFACHNGDAFTEQALNNLKLLCMELELIREFINEPIIVVSGYRSIRYNKRIGGAKYSQHIAGKAADIKARHYTAEELHATILQLIDAGTIRNGGVGLYDTFVHYDIRKKATRWNG